MYSNVNTLLGFLNSSKNLAEDQCAIIYIDGSVPKIYKIMYINDAITGIAEDRLAGTNDIIPPNKANWGIFTKNRSDAFFIWHTVFFSVEEEHSWIGHSPLPHFHTAPHTIKINGVDTTPHAWFLEYE